MSPLFILQLKMQGSLCDRLRGSNGTSTLIPDVDNAAVGNDFALLQEDTTKGILLFF